MLRATWGMFGSRKAQAIQRYRESFAGRLHTVTIWISDRKMDNGKHFRLTTGSKFMMTYSEELI